MSRMAAGDPRDVLLAPVVSREELRPARRRTSTRSWCARTPTRPRSSSRSRRSSASRSSSVNTLNRAGQAPAHPLRLRPPGRHQARDRERRRRRPHRPVRRARVLGAETELENDMGIRKYKPTTPGRRGSSVADFVEITRSTPERSLVRPLPQEGRPQQHRPHHHAAPGRRAQARLPHHRLRPRQARHPGQGGFDRIRSEPHRLHRAPELRGRREALHRVPAQPEGRRLGVREGDTEADIKPGNNLPLGNIPVGTLYPQHRGHSWPRW